MLNIKKGSSFAKMVIMVIWWEEFYKEEDGLVNNKQVISNLIDCYI